MIKLLSCYIYSMKDNFVCTFNLPDKQEDKVDMIELALDIVYYKKIVNSSNIKSFYMNDFQYIFTSPDAVRYIQKMPEKGKGFSIVP